MFRYLLVFCQIVVTEGTEDWTSSNIQTLLNSSNFQRGAEVKKSFRVNYIKLSSEPQREESSSN